MSKYTVWKAVASEILSNNNLSFSESYLKPDCLQERGTVMAWDSDTHLRQGIEMDWADARGRINWQNSKLIIQRLRYLHENTRWAMGSAKHKGGRGED